MAADPALLAETLCIEEERVVARDNTVAYDSRRLQLPASNARAHYVKARVKVREYPDGSLAVFHGPRRIAALHRAGGADRRGPDHHKRDTVLAAVKAWPVGAEPAAPPQRRPSLTAAARGVTPPRQVGTKKRPSGRTKKPTRKNSTTVPAPA